MNIVTLVIVALAAGTVVYWLTRKTSVSTGTGPGGTVKPKPLPPTDPDGV